MGEAGTRTTYTLLTMIAFKHSLIALAALAAPLLQAEPELIPRPSEVSWQKDTTNLAAFSTIEAAAELSFEKDYLAKTLQSWMQRSSTQAPAGAAKTIMLRTGKLDSDYLLEVKPEAITITGKDAAGVFYGIQTLLQLVTLEKDKADFQIPLGTVKDSARYGWRGLMLDSSRHFQTVEEVKHFLDMMAYYKYNVFHWHLTDDQGWRIEIKSRPKLTSIGAWRVPREGIWWTRPGPMKNEKATDGGFYTQEQIKEIVKYAAERHIEVIPEIDVPGHALSILAAYPELSTTGGPFQVNPGSKFYNIIENTLDPSNPETYKFLDDVFRETCQLFPSQYVHIGGDEATKKYWNADPDCQAFMKEKGLKDAHELQSYFIKRVEAMLAKHNKKIIGWDEILEGGLAESATVMSWRGVGGANKAAKMGRQVVIAANSAYYFDLYQGHQSYEPATYSKLRLKKSYHFDYQLPKGVDEKLLLGLHGALWTEEIPNMRHCEYMLWPRGFALADAAWSTQTKKDWPEFVERVEAHFKRLDFLDINYATSIYDPIIQMKKINKREVITLSTEVDGLDIHYTFDEGEVDHHYPVYKEPLVVPYGATTIRMRTYRDGKPVGKLRTAIIKDINAAKKLLFPTPIEN
ncbi:hexosaminidase [Rubritalea squalenifaciens DSM 18772]|uniref:beta-N-acetylhexosaminidase n=2 Tax=Rubritalea squalenifaciens TaxID=407226 RepID=A0A1M6D1C8_9BACT|nr:hexosaminidase [Rubritalea squalenifaciens DSM 18772]